MFGLIKAGALGYPQLNIDLKTMLLFGSLIVAIDPVAVLAIFQNIGVEKGLYYLVFGESLLNDAITIVLYEIMSAFVAEHNITGNQIGIGIASFFTVSFGGLLIGVIFGILSCLITRLKSHLSSFTVILLAYFAYIFGDLVGWSGIISMIGCGVVQAAYAFDNMHPSSAALVHGITKLISEISESVIFLFLGIEVLSEHLEWHTGFVLWSLVLCLISRGLVVLGITAIVNAVRVDGTKISFQKQLILIYGGLRGAVAFSLAVLINEHQLGYYGEYNRHLIITTTLFITIFTIGVMGMTIKPLVKVLNIPLQPKSQLSLVHALNDTLLDNLLAGVENIAGFRGRQSIRHFFEYLDERYFRRFLQRKPQKYNRKVIQVYDQLITRLHAAFMQPDRAYKLLADVPPTLRDFDYLKSSLSASFHKRPSILTVRDCRCRKEPPISPTPNLSTGSEQVKCAPCVQWINDVDQYHHE
ncbi:hypothetical protein EG68_03530 [Paragonimus skrjabini miyazakii]|uniref:Sodium/hydrogen exchanger n=1 Tax=Paragonimus skrjabini miyazakii TaxID=59628 RepID=A0A8S9Z001_9TREM|nr:hypothetical protein EG68_03530 [Paragonimus skrjabini miyazakii]